MRKPEWERLRSGKDNGVSWLCPSLSGAKETRLLAVPGPHNTPLPNLAGQWWCKTKASVCKNQNSVLP